MPGVAFQNPSQGQVAALDNAVSFYGFPGVAGAAGIKAAMLAQERTQQQLVTIDQEKGDTAHGDRGVSQVVTGGGPAVATAAAI